MEITILTESEIRSCVALDQEVISAVGEAFARLAAGEATLPPPSREPYLRAEWLHPGLHITAMGSDAEEKQELFPDVLTNVDLLACDRRSQCFRLGELHHGLEAGIISREDEIVELGELVSGRRPGRTGDQEITLCDLTGVGMQDTAIALLATRKAAERGLGLQVTV
jgi:ornithine cyclodeaminase/alanine dehydrogenase-like protein (mu-crystallin family)